ncbi:hypothetical protein CHUAL_011933 [Chamberlinius hualienensis]
MENYELNGLSPKCIVFNHGTYSQKFSHISRSDEQQNADRMTKTFQVMGIPDFEINKDFTVDQIYSRLTDVTSNDLSNNSCLIVFILTHGWINYKLLANDELYSLKQLVKKIMKNPHPSFKEKPIVFIVEACNGDRNDYGASKAYGSARNNPFSTGSMSLFIHRHPHMFLALSSSPDAPSYMSWYIPTLCNVFQEHYKKVDIETMLLITKQKVAEKYGYEGGRSSQIVKQMPMIISTLAKRLYLTIL